MKQNPFKYGELSSGANFCNRKEEIRRLHAGFRDGQSIILISPRRWGKSSLVNQALATYNGRLISIKIDCFGLRSSAEFYSTLLRSVLQSTSTKLQQVADTVKSYVKAFIPFIKYGVGEGEEIKISLEIPQDKMDVAAILDLTQKIASARKIRIVLCIDEFQKIAEWSDGKSVLEKLRSHWQKHRDVSYCLYGSKRHVMASLFADSSQPFYRFGENIFLQKIDWSEWVKFLVHNFQRTGKRIEEAIAAVLVEKVNAHSYFVQYLARICWNNGVDKITKVILDAAFLELLNDHLALFQNMTKGLTSYQTNYIKALIAGEKQFTSQRVLNQYGIGSPGNIKRIETTLEDMEILDYSGENPEFCDPYFEPLFQKYFIENR
ncbi:MAG: ATP-binding protein [Cyclobacteriaceae bacterium]|nr:ATP-binding protein [Cyclobacteriaceae bacterium]MDH4295741.1 ATP-binding protein [Cyclobacteriaceae bacterium]MDH5249567.1 ATP-binding protein [Cyclobacteriaceae bacterium]